MRIDTFRKAVLALPEITEQPHHHYASFRVRGKIIATVPPENTHVHFFVDDDARERALALYPDCLEVLMWGRKVSGLRMTLARATPEIVRELLRQAWRHRAPKTLQGALCSGPVD